MSLLTPSESHAFQSFLSAIDYDAHSLADQVFAPEWSILSDDMHVPQPPPGKEALTKATKDLMSLQPQSFNPPSYSSWPSQRPQTAHSVPSPLSPNSPAPTQQLQSTTTNNSNHTSNNSHNNNNTNPFFLFHQRRASSAAYNDPPIPTATHPHALMLSTSPSSSISYAPIPSSPAPTSSKRSYSEDSTTASQSQSRPSTAKRRRPSSPGPAPSRHASSPSINGGSSGGAGKPALLSVSQKKANHIQSEQKRRANIRRGYEALCETVPALKEAIRLEDEASRASGGAGAGVAKRRKSRTKGSGNGKGEREGEDGGDLKADGRAGPRSENIVLQKTVDYIQDMLSEKQQLLARLQRAQSALPPGHPALALAHGSRDVVMWEREWTGGSGLNDDNSSDEDE